MLLGRSWNVVSISRLRRPAPNLLTRREKDVMRWMAEGKTTGDIGQLLAISPHTVGEHLKNIRRKLGTLNGAHTIAEAIRRGELDINSALPEARIASRIEDSHLVGLG